MISDHLSHLHHYQALAPAAFSVMKKFLQEQNLAQLPTGRHELSEGLYALVSEYETRLADDSASFIECHRRYLDVQIMVKGEENVGYAPLERLPSDPASPYHAEHDYEKRLRQLAGKDQLSFYPLLADHFMIFFPQDGHMPCIQLNGATKVRKVVIKVPTQI